MSSDIFNRRTVANLALLTLMIGFSLSSLYYCECTAINSFGRKVPAISVHINSCECSINGYNPQTTFRHYLSSYIKKLTYMNLRNKRFNLIVTAGNGNLFDPS